MTALVSADDGEQSPSVGAGPVDSTTHGGVRALLVRDGCGEPLFVVPGLDGDPAEMALLVSAFTGPQPVYVLVAELTDGRGQPISTIEHIAQLMVAALRELAPHGPYRLAGYSFGALVALEIAQQLDAAGERAENVFLIDAVYDERYWPRRIWVRALLRRTGWQLGRIARMRPAAAMAQSVVSVRRLSQRVVRRNVASGDPLHDSGPDTEVTTSTRAYSAMSRYVPRRYDGTVTLIASSVDRHFGCDTTTIWSGYARHLEIERVEGDHLTVMHDAHGAAAVARVIDHRLALTSASWSGLRPVPGFERPLIVSTMRWFSAARLAHALAEAGFTVSACFPPSHPLELIDTLETTSRLRKSRPLRSLRATIDRANPDLVLCDDERALVLMRRLHDRVRDTDPELAAVLARSLGSLDEWPAITSRAGLADTAQRLGLPAPDTTVVTSLDDVRGWVRAHEVPFALKTDGSWGGRGVAIVTDTERLPKVWQTISSPPGLTRALKRAMVNHDTAALVARIRNEHPRVNAQQFCPGRDAIVTAACIDGKVLSLVCLEVVQASEARGPAAVVRIIQHAGMAETATALISRFGLSGFCGFDFALDGDGTARLIEINPRVTPTCHLLVEGECHTNRLVALFPFEMLRDRVSTAESLAVLDVPVRAPLLVDHGTRLVAARHRPIARAMRSLQRVGRHRF